MKKLLIAALSFFSLCSALVFAEDTTVRVQYSPFLFTNDAWKIDFNNQHGEEESLVVARVGKSGEFLVQSLEQFRATEPGPLPKDFRKTLWLEFPSEQDKDAFLTTIHQIADSGIATGMEDFILNFEEAHRKFYGPRFGLAIMMTSFAISALATDIILLNLHPPSDPMRRNLLSSGLRTLLSGLLGSTGMLAGAFLREWKVKRLEFLFKLDDRVNSTVTGQTLKGAIAGSASAACIYALLALGR